MFQIWTLGFLSFWFLCPFDVPHCCWWRESVCVCMCMCMCACMNTYVLSGTARSSSLILYISCSSLRISHLSKEPSFFLLENDTGNQHLGTSYARCSWDVVASRSSQLTQQGNVCILTHVSINIAICNHLYLNKAKHEFILISPTLFHYYMYHSSLLSCLSVNSHTNNKIPGSYHPTSFYLLA